MSREGPEHSLLTATVAVRGHVLLVGSNHQENLALQYLASSLEEAGFSVDIVGFNDRSDAAFVLRRIHECPPLLIGIQFAFQYTVDDNLWLARALRDDGFSGHLTAGGHVATFCYRELLVEGSPLDSVVRHEGERTLVEMATRVSVGQSIAGISGCVHRLTSPLSVEPIRPLLRTLDTLKVPRRPGQPYRVAGVPIAFVVTSRGCHGDCNYCCINAFTRDAGGPPYRLRSVTAVADELAQLAQRGVRAVFMQDDLFILPAERAALARLNALSDAFQRIRLPELALWIKGRPEAVTRSVLQAARKLGAIHLFLGIENVSAERLRYLGRTHRPEDAERALTLCSEEGVYPSFNVMLFDPDTSLSDVERNLDFLERHIDLPWNVCRTEVYPGTHLFSQLNSEGRLIGDFRSWGYRMTSPEAELLFRILRVCIHERALATNSLHNRLISLAFAWQLHLHLFPDPSTRALASQASALGCAVRQDTVNIMRRASNWVREHAWRLEDTGESSRRELAALVNQFALGEGRSAGLRDFPRHQEVDRLWEVLVARGQHFCERRAAPAPAPAPAVVPRRADA